MNNKKEEKNNTLFLIIMFVGILVIVLFLPKIYSFIEEKKLPKVEKTEVQKEEKQEITEEILESVHYPIMRNSVYDSKTYYSLDTFKISNMSNSDILYNAFMDIYEGNITSLNTAGTCTAQSKQFNIDYMELRIKNILGKSVNYTLESFYVPEDADSNYKGTWTYDSINSRFVYNGLCGSKATNTKYYDLEQLIKVEYENKDIAAYYYVGFAKVVNNNYIIYKDANMTVELKNGTFTTIDDLNTIFEGLDKKDKKIYKYTFKNTLCSYNEYCLYEGKWINEL